MGSPRLSLRRLENLLSHLPREAWYVRAVLGDIGRWGDTEHLLADVLDLLQAQMWQYATVHSKRRPKRPKPVSRPGVVDKVVRHGTAKMTVPEVRTYLDRFKPPEG